MVISQLGCAWGKFGKADGGVFDINKPSGLKGQSKSSIMEILGDPELVLVEKKTEYWGYRNHNGWYFAAYFANFGMTEAKDLILEFHDEKVKTAYLIHKGFSFGIITPPMAVAN
jgi:hypothetical protein